MAVSDPSVAGFGGGVRMVEHAEDPTVWEDTSEGFGLAVMHQIHCIVSISQSSSMLYTAKTLQALLKRTILEYRRHDIVTAEDEHQDHCVEYLRQVSCAFA